MKVIKSGDCIMGIVGTPTPMKDLMGKELFVGGLVRLFHFDSDGRVCSDHGLTYVADGSINAYSEIASCDGVADPFIMGIKHCKLGETQDYGGYWHVKKVKRYNIKNRKSLYTPHTIEEADVPKSFMKVTY